jgi:hypothetical protein
MPSRFHNIAWRMEYVYIIFVQSRLLSAGRIIASKSFSGAVTSELNCGGALHRLAFRLSADSQHLSFLNGNTLVLTASIFPGYILGLFEDSGPPSWCGRFRSRTDPRDKVQGGQKQKYVGLINREAFPRPYIGQVSGEIEGRVPQT